MGSIIGPTLLLIYSDDPYKATTLKLFLFADDTTAPQTKNNLIQLFAEINSKLWTLKNV